MNIYKDLTIIDHFRKEFDFKTPLTASVVLELIADLSGLMPVGFAFERGGREVLSNVLNHYLNLVKDENKKPFVLGTIRHIEERYNIGVL